MDLRKIKKLIELVEESGIAELEVKSGEEAVRITMNTAQGAVFSPIPATVAPVAATELPAGTAVGSDASMSPPQSTGKPLGSPLSGTFYTSPSPDSAPFVTEGDRVAKGDVLCIVESMKMMNRIEADKSGVIAAVLVTNGEPVESGQPLFLIDE